MTVLPETTLNQVLLAVIVIMAVIAAAFAVVTSHRRRARQEARSSAHALERRFADFLAGRVSADALRDAAECADGSAFWTALESSALGLESDDCERLAAALGDGVHAEVERDLLEDDSPWRRELAARRLGLVRVPAARRALRRAMVRGPEPVRYAAALALGRARDMGALRWLLKHPAALARRTPRGRIAVLSAFGPGAIAELHAALLRAGGDPNLERAIIEILGLAGHGAASPAIEKRLREPDLELRIAAARALGRLQANASANALLEALQDGDWQVRAQAARAFGRMRSPLAVHALASSLTDRSWWVRRHAAYALAELGEEGRKALRTAASGSEDPYARDMAREALDGGFPISA